MKRALVAVLVGLGLLVGGYAFGRYAQPAKVVTKVETKVETQYVHQVVEKKVAGPVRVVTVEHTVTVPATASCPAHQETTITTTTDQGPVVTNTSSDTQATQDVEQHQEKVVQYNRPRYLLQVSQDVLHLQDPRRLAGSVSVRVLGPLYLGAEVRADDWRHPRLVLSGTF